MRAVVAFAAALLAFGCASVSDPLGHRDALTDAQKRYTDLIRWRDAAKASIFVEPEVRKEFLAQAGLLDTLEISDYEIGDFEWGEDDKTAKVPVTFRGYSLSHLVEHKIVVLQEWHRGEDGSWRVKPDLDAVVAALRGTPR
jgi:hypothetical protein